MDPSYEERFNAAIQLRNDGELEISLGLLCQLYSERSEVSITLPIIGGILMTLSRYSEAAHYFRLHTNTKPLNWISSMALYSALLNADRIDEALAEGSRFLNLMESGVSVIPNRNHTDQMEIAEYVEEVKQLLNSYQQ